MVTRLKYIVMTVIMALAAAITSCEHKDILDPGNGLHQVNLLFMWDDYPDASPKGMTVYFFPVNSGGKIWRYDIPGRDGGPVELPAGRYDMLAFNNDLPGVAFSGMTSLRNGIASAVVRNGISQGIGELYAAVVENIEVTPCGVCYKTPDGNEKVCRQWKVRCYPQQRFCNYRVVARNVKGIGTVRKAEVSLSGMAGRMELASGRLCDDQVQLAAALKVEGNSLEGSSAAFGVAPSAGKIIARINVKRTDGAVLAKEYDVTSQVTGAADPRDVTIYIDDVEIPSPGENPGGGGDVGLDVWVDGWQVITIEITT